MQKKKFNTIGIIAKHNIQHEQTFVRKLCAFLQKKGKEVVLDANAAQLLKKRNGISKKALLQKVDLAIVLGGDGTLLKTARSISCNGVYILGVNLGKLGFLTELSKREMFRKLYVILQGRYAMDARSMLRVTLERKGKEVASSLALNDVVINQGAFARLIQLEISIDRRNIATFNADGLIIATPTGSTGHALSAGGPIVQPNVTGMVIVPICPASLHSRPIVIPDDKEIVVTINTKQRPQNIELGLTIDGQEIIPLQYDDKIHIRKSSFAFNLIRTHGKKYYNVLREKLNWGEE